MENRFDSHAHEWDHKPYRIRLAEEVAAAIRLAAPLEPQWDVLDFGCGTGLVSMDFAGEVRSLTGVDNSAGMLEVFNRKATERGLSTVVGLHLNLEGDDQLPGNYDLILSSMTFHHLEDVPGMTHKLVASLKPGGRLCIADLEPDHGHFHSDNAGVIHLGFERTTMEGFFKAAGLTEVETTTATRLTRPGQDGVEREFTVFLTTGRVTGDR
ncbi:MAG: class I SAM-dependent methyltransferase [Bacteroidales bacterium]